MFNFLVVVFFIYYWGLFSCSRYHAIRGANGHTIVDSFLYPMTFPVWMLLDWIEHRKLKKKIAAIAKQVEEETDRKIQNARKD